MLVAGSAPASLSNNEICPGVSRASTPSSNTGHGLLTTLTQGTRAGLHCPNGWLQPARENPILFFASCSPAPTPQGSFVCLSVVEASPQCPLHPSPPPSILSTLCRLALSQAGSHTGETGHHSPCPDWKHNVFVQILKNICPCCKLHLFSLYFFCINCKNS